MKMPTTIAGHRVEVLGLVRQVDGQWTYEVTLTRLWWAPLPLAWMGAGMVDPWWFRPVAFVMLLWLLARDRGVE